MKNQDTVRGFLIGSYPAENYEKFPKGISKIALDTSIQVLDSIKDSEIKPIFFELNGVDPSKTNPDLLFNGSKAGSGLIEVHANDSFKNGPVRNSIKEFGRTATTINAAISAGGGSSNAIFIPLYEDLASQAHIRKNLVHIINPAVNPAKMSRRIYDLHSVISTKNVINFICKNIDSVSKLWSVLESAQLDRFMAIYINTPSFKQKDESEFNVVLHAQTEIPIDDFNNSLINYTYNRLQKRFEEGSPHLKAAEIAHYKNQINFQLNAILNMITKQFSFNIDDWQYFKNHHDLSEKYRITVETIVFNLLEGSQKNITKLEAAINFLGLTNISDVLNDYLKHLENIKKNTEKSIQSINAKKLLSEFANCNKSFLKFFKRRNIDNLFNKISELLGNEIKYELISEISLKINQLLSKYSGTSDENSGEFNYNSKLLDSLLEIAIHESDLSTRTNKLEEQIRESQFELINEYLKYRLGEKLKFDFSVNSQQVLDNLILLSYMPEELIKKGLDKNIMNYLHVDEAFVNIKSNTENKIVMDLFAIINHLDQVPALQYLIEGEEKTETLNREVFQKRCRTVADAFPAKIIRGKEISRSELAYLAVKSFLASNVLTVFKKKEKLTIQLKLPNSILSLTNSGTSINPPVTGRLLGFKEEKYINEKFWNETFAADRKGTIAALEKIVNATIDKSESERLAGLYKFFTRRVITKAAEQLLNQAQLANSFYSN